MFIGCNTNPVAQSKREKGKQKWQASRGGGGQGTKKAVRPVDQARPKCKGCLAGAARLGSSNRFTNMTSVAPVQLSLW